MTEVERRWQARRELWTKSLGPLELAGKRVLDAGTGEGHCTRYLAECNPSELVSITCLAEEIPPAQARLGEFADRVRFEVADLANLSTVPAADFDVVVGDFLIAAVATYTPFREIDVLGELARVLKPGGRLVITGWDLWQAPRDRLDASLRELFDFRSAAARLGGREPFREHPRWWVERRLAELDAPPERTEVVADVHRALSWAGRQTRRSLENVEPAALRAELEMKLAELERGVVDHPRLAAGVHFGDLYAVVGL
ncbi:MAG TPA: class I SAM-dependent methyltransferase, partial [Planctomycetia bacterium]|nr:class I SAM-dependent methyltransferase [Planctomycetia bacterium]